MSGFPSRCQHLKINGTQCESPALRRQRFCFFHKRFQDERIKLAAHGRGRAAATFLLPVLEDADSIQIALMQVMRLIISQQIDHKAASLLLYALQTASSNLRVTKLKPFRHEIVLDPHDVADTPLGKDIWSDRDFEEEDEVEEEPEPQPTPPPPKPRNGQQARAALHREAEQQRDQTPWYLRNQPSAPLPTPSASPETTAAAVPPPAALTSPAVPSPAVPPPAVNPAAVNPPKKPASSLNPEKVRAELTDMIRKELPALTEVLAQANRSKKGG